MDLQEVLAYLTVGGSAVVAGALTSSVYEKMAWFQALMPGQRLGVTVGTSVALGLGSALILAFVPVETLQAIQPYFGAFVAAVAPFLGQELWHKLTKQAQG